MNFNSVKKKMLDTYYLPSHVEITGNEAAQLRWNMEVRGMKQLWSILDR